MSRVQILSVVKVRKTDRYFSKNAGALGKQAPNAPVGRFGRRAQKRLWASLRGFTPRARRFASFLPSENLFSKGKRSSSPCPCQNKKSWELSSPDFWGITTKPMHTALFSKSSRAILFLDRPLPWWNRGLQVTAIFRTGRAMLVNELMYRQNYWRLYYTIAFILSFHKNKPNARLSCVWLCRLLS